MRERINENPMVQAALIGVMVLVFAVVLFTRVMGGGGSSEPAADGAATAGDVAPPTVDSSTPSPATGTAPADSSASAPAPADTGSAPATGAEVAGELEAGKGMPADVVDAYDAGKVVVLLVVEKSGIDDKRVEKAAQDLDGRDDLAFFESDVKHVAVYSQITNGSLNSNSRVVGRSVM